MCAEQASAQRWLHAVGIEGDRLAGTDIRAFSHMVPSRPSWSVADLIGHVGAVHRWALALTTAQADAPKSYNGVPVPAKSELVPWHVVSRDALCKVLADEPADVALCDSASNLFLASGIGTRFPTSASSGMPLLPAASSGSSMCPKGRYTHLRPALPISHPITTS